MSTTAFDGGRPSDPRRTLRIVEPAPVALSVTERVPLATVVATSMRGRGKHPPADVGVRVGLGVEVGVEVGVGVNFCVELPTAAAASRRPYVQRLPVPLMRVAVLVMRSTTACGLVPYSVAQTNAATPATCGVAGDVPLTVRYPPSKSVERMSTPGAARY